METAGRPSHDDTITFASWALSGASNLEPGAWTRVRIVVKGGEARLFVHGAEQPSLVVKDMKRAPTRGFTIRTGRINRATERDVSQPPGEKH